MRVGESKVSNRTLTHLKNSNIIHIYPQVAHYRELLVTGSLITEALFTSPKTSKVARSDSSVV